jgi:hypothetical protein
MEVKISILIWIMTPCNLVGVYECPGGMYCFRLQADLSCTAGC